MSGDSTRTRLRETVTQAVNALPPELRAPVLLRYREKFSYEEIARRLSLPDEGVRGRICTAALRLHAKFGLHLGDGHGILAEPVPSSGDCRSIEKHIPRYVEQILSGEDQHTVDAHISKCASCFELVARFRAVWNLLQSTYESIKPGPKDGMLRSPFAAPSQEEDIDSTFGLGDRIPPLHEDGPVDPASAAAELAALFGIGEAPAFPKVRNERPIGAPPPIAIEPDPSSRVFDSTVTVTPLPENVQPLATIVPEIVPETAPIVTPVVISSPEPIQPPRDVAPPAPVAAAEPTPPVAAPVVVNQIPPLAPSVAVPVTAAPVEAALAAPPAASEVPVATTTATEPKKEMPRPPLFANLRRTLASAPFWFVSLALHGLLITLAALLTMTIKTPGDDDRITVTTELCKQPSHSIEELEAKKNLPSALESRPENLADPESSSKIVVPEDILARAEVGDHFETINPEMPDTHSALGVEDAKIMDTAQGRVDAPGGGGDDGVKPEDIIGVGGSGNFGKGHGFGGGKGTGVGLDVGAGKGSFGHRDGGGRKLMVEKHGGSPATESAVEKALQWLAYHQEADGHWGVARRDPVVFCTSIATLAFLGAGHTEKTGKYRDNVTKAVAFLRNQSYQSRQLGNAYIRNAESSGYSLAVMTMALSEAAGMANIPETRTAAQKLVTYCIEVHQGGSGSEKTAWRYQPKQDPDLSVSGWFIMALKSAKIAGLHVDPASFEGADRFIRSVQYKVNDKNSDPEYGPVYEYGYMPLPQSVPGFNARVIRAMSGSDCCQAIANLCRQFMGYKKADLQTSIEHFVRQYGVPTAGKENLYYWYYGTLCTFQQGGEVWKKWNAGMQEALLSTQEKDGDNSGSWAPAGMYGMNWGRVGQTSIAALCLEVYYRYSKLTDDK